MRTLSLVEVEQVSGAGIIANIISALVNGGKTNRNPSSSTVTSPNCTDKPDPLGPTCKPPKLEPEPCWMFGW